MGQSLVRPFKASLEGSDVAPTARSVRAGVLGRSRGTAPSAGVTLAPAVSPQTAGRDSLSSALSRASKLVAA